MRSIILISEDRVKTVSNLDNNVFGKWLLPAIREAQDVNLQSIIGSTLYNQILTLVDSGDIALPEYDLYKDLLDNQIADFLVYQSLVNVIPLINVNMANMGTVISNDEHIQTLSQGNVDLVRGYYQNLADIYQKRLQDFLKCHREYFPELNDCACDNCGVKPNLNSNTNTSGIWLGGLRNPKKVRGTSGCCGGTSKGDGEYKDGFDAGVAFQKNKLASTAFTENGNYQREDGWNSVSVNVPTGTGHTDEELEEAYQSGKTDQKNLLVATAFTQNGTYSRTNGWSGVTVNVPDRYDEGFESGYTSGETHQKSLLVATAFTQNGTYSKINGWSGVTVNVPEKQLQDRTVFYSSNGSYEVWSTGKYDGLNTVTVNVDVPDRYNEGFESGYTSGETHQKSLLVSTAVTANGTYSRENGYSSINVNVPQTGYTQDDLDDAYQSGKTDQKNLLVSTAVTANGTYSRENGYSSINVNVPDRYDEGFNNGTEYQKSLIIDLYVTENGIYQRKDGYSPITVNVPQTGYTQEDLDEAYNQGYEDGYNNRSRITVLPLTVNAGGTGETGTISVSSNTDWIVDSVPSWITLSALSGNGDTTITYTVISNTGDTRSDNIVFKTSDNYSSATTVVNQEEIVAEISAVPSSNNVSWSARTITLTVTANTSWCVTGYPEWAVPNVTSGTSGTTTVTVNLPINEGEERRGYVYFDTIYGSGNATVYIRQGYNPTPSPTGYTSQYLTIEALEDGSIKWNKEVSGYAKAIQYKLNDGEWTSIVSITGGTSIPVVSGDTVQFRGNNSTYNTNSFSGSTCQFKVYGNIMSLINSTDFANLKSLPTNGSFCKLFAGTKVVEAENLILPATACTNYCYQDMFSGCANLTSAPSLPAITLAERCYDGMFENCTALRSTPVLPATTLAPYCYDSMFYGCRNLANATTLSATTMEDSCYLWMFGWCTSLETPPIISATTLASDCFRNMFTSSGLRSIPTNYLPVTTLQNSCYKYMFSCIETLTDISNLILPATTMKDSCYYGMFERCINITAAPELPATTLAASCYNQMFKGCVHLIQAPELPATTLKSSCYEKMFYNTSRLRYVKCLGTSGIDGSNTGDWLYGAGIYATIKTFVKAPNASWQRDNSGIPTGWTVENNS